MSCECVSILTSWFVRDIAEIIRGYAGEVTEKQIQHLLFKRGRPENISFPCHGSTIPARLSFMSDIKTCEKIIQVYMPNFSVVFLGVRVESASLTAWMRQVDLPMMREMLKKSCVKTFSNSIPVSEVLIADRAVFPETIVAYLNSLGQKLQDEIIPTCAHGTD
jgi:hypothetical protein